MGVGNLLVGQSKSSHYARALREAAAPSRGHPHGKHAPDSLYVKRLESRRSYYHIVRTGGTCILVLGIGLLLFPALRREPVAVSDPALSGSYPPERTPDEHNAVCSDPGREVKRLTPSA
jgi:hypothetical protein